jgi:hypothetical protein
VKIAQIGTMRNWSLLRWMSSPLLSWSPHLLEAGIERRAYSGRTPREVEIIYEHSSQAEVTRVLHDPDGF